MECGHHAGHDVVAAQQPSDFGLDTGPGARAELAQQLAVETRMHVDRGQQAFVTRQSSVGERASAPSHGGTGVVGAGSVLGVVGSRSSGA